MMVTVFEASVPAYSTIGYGTGKDEKGNIVHFAGDHRPMREIVLALRRGEEPEVEVEDRQIQRYEIVEPTQNA